QGRPEIKRDRPQQGLLTIVHPVCPHPARSHPVCSHPGRKCTSAEGPSCCRRPIKRWVAAGRSAQRGTSAAATGGGGLRAPPTQRTPSIPRAGGGLQPPPTQRTPSIPRAGGGLQAPPTRTNSRIRAHLAPPKRHVLEQQVQILDRPTRLLPGPLLHLVLPVRI